MKEKLRFNLIFLFLIVNHYSAAQESFSFSDHFGQFFNNYYLLNPANADSSYQIALKAADKTQTGLFRGVNQIYLDADLQLSSGENFSHYIGIQAINNREGDFISKNRLHGRYSWRARISQGATLSAGIALGFVNYAFNTSQSGTGGSDLVPDGNAGIWYLRRKLSVGFSIQQLFDQQIRPVNQAFVLERYYNLTARHALPLNPYLTLHTHFYSKLQKEYSYMKAAILFELQEKLEAGISYRYLRGLTYILGAKNIRIGNSRFAFYFCYSGGNRVVNINDNAVEFFLSFQYE